MRKHVGVQAILGSVVAIAMYLAAVTITGAASPLAINSARISISGTSNIHDYTASTTTIRVTRSELGSALAGSDFWATALNPGVVKSFEVAIPAGTLTSAQEDLDKNMYKALKVQDHSDITFRLLRFEMKEKGSTRAIGVLQVAGVEREVALDITTERKGSVLNVQGRVRLLMTDFGITPPVAMLGMLKTDPKVTVTFETALTVPQT